METKVNFLSPNKLNSIFFWRIAFIFIIFMSILVRVLVGMKNPGLWLDEILWINRINSEFISGIRADGYVLFNQLYFHFISNYEEYKVRMFSIIPGILFIPLFALVIHKLFKNNWLTLFGSCLAGINFALSSFTFEFKPYSLDLFLHTLWFLCLLNENKAKSAILSSTFLIVGAFFSYSFIPLFVFQLVYLAYLFKNKEISFKILLSSNLMILMYLGYFFYKYLHMMGNHPAFWGEKYGIFYNKNSSDGWFIYTVKKISSYASYPLNWFKLEDTHFIAFGFPKGFGYLENFFLGLVYLVLILSRAVNTRWNELRLLPLYILLGYILAGILHIWPLGYFRTNVFMFLYATLVLLYLFEGLHKFSKLARIGIILLVISPTIYFTYKGPLFEKYFQSSSYKKVISTICDVFPNQSIEIIADNRAKTSLLFYQQQPFFQNTCLRKAVISTLPDLKSFSPKANSIVIVEGLEKEKINDFFSNKNYATSLNGFRDTAIFVINGKST